MIPENRFPRRKDAAGELEGFSVKQKIEKLKKFHSIRFSLTSVVALLILLSVFISSTLSYSRYTRDFQEQSSEQIDQTLEQLSINLSTYLDELFRDRKSVV